MARPAGNVFARREHTVEDLREEFLAQARAKNLAPRTIEWYARHTLGFLRWYSAHEVVEASGLRSADLDDFLVSMHASGARALHRPRRRAIAASATFEHTFMKAGDSYYYCKVHGAAMMSGEIKVA